MAQKNRLISVFEFYTFWFIIIQESSHNFRLMKKFLKVAQNLKNFSKSFDKLRVKNHIYACISDHIRQFYVSIINCSDKARYAYV